MFRLKIDYPLLLGLVTLCIFSLLILWSAGGQSTRLISNQGIRTVSYTHLTLPTIYSV